MSQELIQNKKQLTFEEICPTYSEIFANWDTLTINEKRVIITNMRHSTARCVMGEAYHGFSGYPDICDDCRVHGTIDLGIPHAFSETFFIKDNNVIDEVNVDWEELEEKKSLFVEHWNKCHPNINEEIKKYLGYEEE